MKLIFLDSSSKHYGVERKVIVETDFIEHVTFDRQESEEEVNSAGEIVGANLQFTSGKYLNVVWNEDERAFLDVISGAHQGRNDYSGLT